MTEIVTYLDRLREIALDQHGFVTTAQAVVAGIPRTELPKLAARNRITRVGHGIYRIPQVPGSEFENLTLALLSTGAPEAYLSHETALDVWGICDVNPEVIHVSVNKDRRIRRAASAHHILHYRDVDSSVTTWWKEVLVSDPVCTIQDCIVWGTPAYLLRQAIQEASSRGLLSPSRHDELLKQLGTREANASA
jgi:predicted transcriptional regulator of viral defense system